MRTVSPYLKLSYPNSSYLRLSYIMLSHLISYHLRLSYLSLLRLILNYLIPSYFTLSYEGSGRTLKMSALYSVRRMVKQVRKGGALQGARNALFSKQLCTMQGAPVRILMTLISIYVGTSRKNALCPRTISVLTIAGHRVPAQNWK